MPIRVISDGYHKLFINNMGTVYFPEDATKWQQVIVDLLALPPKYAIVVQNQCSEEDMHNLLSGNNVINFMIL